MAESLLESSDALWSYQPHMVCKVRLSSSLIKMEKDNTFSFIPLKTHDLLDVETSHCALGRARRLGYIFCDRMSPLVLTPMIDGKHKPAEGEWFTEEVFVERLNSINALL